MKLRNKKTGEVDDFVFEVITNRIDLYRRVGSSDTKNIWKYNTLAELNEDWEDYKPAEPLIKDEKIRKVVRAWAEAQELTEVYLASNGYEIYGGIDDWVMQFKGEPFPFADKNKIYTIAELCGGKNEQKL